MHLYHLCSSAFSLFPLYFTTTSDLLNRLDNSSRTKKDPCPICCKLGRCCKRQTLRLTFHTTLVRWDVVNPEERQLAPLSTSCKSLNTTCTILVNTNVPNLLLSGLILFLSVFFTNTHRAMKKSVLQRNSAPLSPVKQAELSSAMIRGHS